MASQGYSPRILIIEDDPLMALLLKDLLQVYDYAVDTPTGIIDDALDLLKSRHYDFVILDIKLHSYDAYEIVHLLLTNDIPFAFSSGYEQESIPERYQGMPFFQKPYDVDVLHHFIQQELQRAGKEALACNNAGSLKKFPQSEAL